MALSQDWRPEVNLLWPTATDELLLRAATCPPEEARQAFSAWKRACGFRAYSDIDFESSRLLPLVWHNLGREACDDLWGAQMAGLRRFHWVHNSARQRDLWALIGRFNEAGITPLLLKGTALTRAGYYPEAGLRPMLDADLLIGPNSAAKASLLLAELGWQRPTRKRGQGFPLAHAESWTHGPRRELDLHAKLLPYPYPALDAATLTPRAAHASHGGCEFLIPAAGDLLLHACVHGRIYAGGDPRRSLLWGADVFRILTHGGAAIDWQRLRATAEATATVLPLREALGFAAARLDAPVPAAFLAELREMKLTRGQVRPFFRRLAPRNRYPTLAEILENTWDDYVCYARSSGAAPVRRRFAAYAGRGALNGLRSGAALKYGARIVWMAMRQGRSAVARPDLVQAAERRLAGADRKRRLGAAAH